MSLRIVLAMLEPPLPFGSAPARWLYVLLRGLVSRGHRVVALAAASRPEQVEEARALFPAPEYDLRCFPHPRRGRLRSKWATLRRPYAYMFGPELRAALAAALAQPYDLLHLEQRWAGWLGLDRPERALLHVHCLAGIDLPDDPAQPWSVRQERRLLLRTERRLVRRYPRLSAVSPRLEAALRALNPTAATACVPVGLDPTRYPRLDPPPVDAPPVVSVIGNMAWAPSRSAAERLIRRLWPRIRARVPGARLEVVGWSARRVLAAHLGRPDIAIHEDVPDIRPHFARSSLLLYAPEQASGMKVKVLEALAYGVPVVTTPEGVEGLPAEDGLHAGVAADDAGLVERAVALLTRPRLRARQRAAGRALLEAHCGPEATLDALERAYARLFGVGDALR